jgi:hypothetical protein
MRGHDVVYHDLLCLWLYHVIQVIVAAQIVLLNSCMGICDFTNFPGIINPYAIKEDRRELGLYWISAPALALFGSWPFLQIQPKSGSIRNVARFQFWPDLQNGMYSYCSVLYFNYSALHS